MTACGYHIEVVVLLEVESVYKDRARETVQLI